MPSSIVKTVIPVALILLALISHGVVDAIGLGGPKQNHLRLLAEQGLLPDGTPIDGTRALEADVTTAAAADTAASAKIVAEYVQLPLDHFSKYNAAGTFHNRFWASTADYKPGGPVFVYDVGEADAEDYYQSRLADPTNFFKQLVQQFGGVGVVWEHRFYGNSTPVTIDLDTPAEAFEYLNTEQSLADVAAFAHQFSRPALPDQDLTPRGTPWVFVGGSYPGMRAAFMRHLYPNTIYASWASSAPVEAKVDMSVYYEPIYRGMKATGWGNCTNDIQAAVQYIDQALADPVKAAALKRQFLGAGAEKNSNDDFGDALTIIFYLWQSYGMDGGLYSLRNFCNWIEKDPATNATAPAEGFTGDRGAEYVVNRWAAWPNYVSAANYYFTTSCNDTTNATTGTDSDCDLGQRFTDPAMISWTWQYCTQWGFFQSANLGPHQIVSSYNSLAHQQDICHRQFPGGVLPAWPDTARTNRIFGGWDIRPSNTYWSGGEFDPWRTLSPLSDEPGAPQPKQVRHVPGCGVSTGANEIFAYTIPGAQHCYDFRTSFGPGAVSRSLFAEALTTWLGCWTATSKGGYGRR